MVNRVLAVTATVLLVMVVPVRAEDRCAPYYGKGYCTDYANSRLKTKVPGNANTWPTNVATTSPQRGDVAVFSSGKQNHVAVVDDVYYKNGKPSSVKVSEMNYGKAVDKGCEVTDNFGIKTTRNVDLNRVDGFYREKPSTKSPVAGPLKFPSAGVNSFLSRPAFSTGFANSTVPYKPRNNKRTR